MNDPAQHQDDPVKLLKQILGEDEASDSSQLSPLPSDSVVSQGQLGIAQKPPLPQPISIPNRELGGGGVTENVPLVELPEGERIPEDVQGWVEKLQKEDVSLPEPVQNNGEVVLAEPSVTFVDDKIVLPMTQQSFIQHAHTKVTESVRWLREWVQRVILMQGEGKTKFRSE